MESRLRGSLIRVLLRQPSESDSPPFSFFFFFFFLHRVAEFAIPLISFHHGNACHPALCAREHNLVVCKCWSLNASLDGEERGVGDVEPLGRASTPLTYLKHSDGPLLPPPRVSRWSISHFSVQVRSRCSLRIIISDGLWWNPPSPCLVASSDSLPL